MYGHNPSGYFKIEDIALNTCVTDAERNFQDSYEYLS